MGDVSPEFQEEKTNIPEVKTSFSPDFHRRKTFFISKNNLRGMERLEMKIKKTGDENQKDWR